MSDWSGLEVRLMAPGPGRCPDCAGVHEPGEPHDIGSLYYQMKFRQQHGCGPTRWDAAAHCEPAVQAAWAEQTTGEGVAGMT